MGNHLVDLNQIHQKCKYPRCGKKTKSKKIGRGKETTYLNKCTICGGVWMTYMIWIRNTIIFAVPPLTEGTPYSADGDPALEMKKPKFYIQGTEAIS